MDIDTATLALAWLLCQFDAFCFLDNKITTQQAPGVVQSGWSAVVAVVLWRRLLGALGDVNEIADGNIHAMVFRYLLDLWNLLYKVKIIKKHCNQFVSTVTT